MPDDNYDTRWRCSVCGEWKPVPILARDCERRHEAALTVPGETP
jgi:hypothetical protein